MNRIYQPRNPERKLTSPLGVTLVNDTLAKTIRQKTFDQAEKDIIHARKAIIEACDWYEIPTNDQLILLTRICEHDIEEWRQAILETGISKTQIRNILYSPNIYLKHSAFIDGLSSTIKLKKSKLDRERDKRSAQEFTDWIDLHRATQQEDIYGYLKHETIGKGSLQAPKSQELYQKLDDAYQYYLHHKQLKQSDIHDGRSHSEKVAERLLSSYLNLGTYHASVIIDLMYERLQPNTTSTSDIAPQNKIKAIISALPDPQKKLVQDLLRQSTITPDTLDMLERYIPITSLDQKKQYAQEKRKKNARITRLRITHYAHIDLAKQQLSKELQAELQKISDAELVETNDWREVINTHSPDQAPTLISQEPITLPPNISNPHKILTKKWISIYITKDENSYTLRNQKWEPITKTHTDNIEMFPRGSQLIRIDSWDTSELITLSGKSIYRGDISWIGSWSIGNKTVLSVTENRDEVAFYDTWEPVLEGKFNDIGHTPNNKYIIGYQRENSRLWNAEIRDLDWNLVLSAKALKRAWQGSERYRLLARNNWHYTLYDQEIQPILPDMSRTSIDDATTQWDNAVLWAHTTENSIKFTINKKWEIINQLQLPKIKSERAQIVVKDISNDDMKNYQNILIQKTHTNTICSIVDDNGQEHYSFSGNPYSFTRDGKTYIWWECTDSTERRPKYCIYRPDWSLWWGRTFQGISTQRNIEHNWDLYLQVRDHNERYYINQDWKKFFNITFISPINKRTINDKAYLYGKVRSPSSRAQKYALYWMDWQLRWWEMYDEMEEYNELDIDGQTYIQVKKWEDSFCVTQSWKKLFDKTAKDFRSYSHGTNQRIVIQEHTWAKMAYTTDGKPLLNNTYQDIRILERSDNKYCYEVQTWPEQRILINEKEERISKHTFREVHTNSTDHSDDLERVRITNDEWYQNLLNIETWELIFPQKLLSIEHTPHKKIQGQYLTKAKTLDGRIIRLTLDGKEINNTGDTTKLVSTDNSTITGFQIKNDDGTVTIIDATWRHLVNEWHTHFQTFEEDGIITIEWSGGDTPPQRYQYIFPETTVLDNRQHRLLQLLNLIKKCKHAKYDNTIRQEVQDYFHASSLNSSYHKQSPYKKYIDQLPSMKHYMQFLNQQIRHFPQMLLDLTTAKPCAQRKILTKTILYKLLPDLYKQDSTRSKFKDMVDSVTWRWGNTPQPEETSLSDYLSPNNNSLQWWRPEGEPTDSSELLTLSQPIWQSITTSILAWYDTATKRSRLTHAFDLPLHNYEEVDFTLTVTKPNNEVILPSPLYGKIDTATIYTYSPDGTAIPIKRSYNQYWQVIITPPSFCKKIIYTVRVWSIPSPDTQIANISFQKIQQEMSLSESQQQLTTLPFAELDIQEQEFLTSIQTFSPRQKLATIIAYTNHISYYDHSYHQIVPNYDDHSPHEILYLSKLRMSTLKNEEKFSQQQHKRFGWVCVERSLLLANLLRHAWFPNFPQRCFATSWTKIWTGNAHLNILLPRQGKDGTTIFLTLEVPNSDNPIHIQGIQIDPGNELISEEFTGQPLEATQTTTTETEQVNTSTNGKSKKNQATIQPRVLPTSDDDPSIDEAGQNQLVDIPLPVLYANFQQHVEHSPTNEVDQLIKLTQVFFFSGLAQLDNKPTSKNLFKQLAHVISHNKFTREARKRKSVNFLTQLVEELKTANIGEKTPAKYVQTAREEQLATLDQDQIQIYLEAAENLLDTQTTRYLQAIVDKLQLIG